MIEEQDENKFTTKYSQEKASIHEREEVDEEPEVKKVEQ
jgi:hypothetical protein